MTNLLIGSPARDGQVIQVHCAGSACPETIHLKLGLHHSHLPTQCKRRGHSCVDWLLSAVQPYGLISHIARVIAGVTDLHVMPRVGLPICRVTRLRGVYPLGPCTAVFPQTGISTALECIDD